MFRVPASFAAACVLALISTSTAAAQERGQTGLAMGYPTSVSIIWHATDRFAVRPEVTLSKSSSETTNGTTVSSDTLGVGFAVSALFYLGKSDNLSTYIAPRFAYTRNTTENEFESTFVLPRTETTSRTVGFGGTFGAQYALSRLFSVFGEVGLVFSDLHAESDTSSAESNGWGVATRSAVGVILYF